MEVGQPITIRLNKTSYDTEVDVASAIWTGATTIGVAAGTIARTMAGPVTTVACSGDRPLYSALTRDLAADPRLEDLPSVFLRQATLLDPPKPLPNFPAYYYAEPDQTVKTASLKLKASALTRLITLVDNDEVWANNAYRLVDARIVAETQTRRWFHAWNSAVAPTAFTGWLTRTRLVKLLREARRQLRKLHSPPPRPVAAASRIRQQLDRLANFISPHAPPSGPHFQGPARAAAFRLTALA